MPTPQKLVFSISVPKTLPPETWERFAARTRAEGSDPKGVLRRLIEYYIEKGMPDDAQENDARRDLRQGQHD